MSITSTLPGHNPRPSEFIETTRAQDERMEELALEHGDCTIEMGRFSFGTLMYLNFEDGFRCALTEDGEAA